MLASVVLERSEAGFVEGFVGLVVGRGAGSGGVVYVEDSKARVPVVISLKTYTQITPVPTNSRPVGCGWTDILALPPALPLSTVAEAMVEASMQSPVNK